MFISILLNKFFFDMRFKYHFKTMCQCFISLTNCHTLLRKCPSGRRGFVGAGGYLWWRKMAMVLLWVVWVLKTFFLFACLKFFFDIRFKCYFKTMCQCFISLTHCHTLLKNAPLYIVVLCMLVITLGGEK